MAESNWAKSMRGISLTPAEPRQHTRKRVREHWSFVVELDPSDKLRLKQGFKAELIYYNNLVRLFSARVRSSPESISGLTEEYINLLAETAFLLWSAKGLMLLTEAQLNEYTLPESLAPYRKILLGSDGSGKRNLTERLAFFLQEVITYGAGVHPLTRRNMVIEMIRFHKEQAKIYLQTVPKSQQDERAFREAPQSLEIPDEIRKRHIQMPKSVVTVQWTETAEGEGICTIKTPYTMKPIVIGPMNMSEQDWNLVLVHQEPGKIAGQHSPWLVEFYKTSAHYMVKYLDVINAHSGSAFNVAKKQGFKHRIDD